MRFIIDVSIFLTNCGNILGNIWKVVNPKNFVTVTWSLDRTAQWLFTEWWWIFSCCLLVQISFLELTVVLTILMSKMILSIWQSAVIDLVACWAYARFIILGWALGWGSKGSLLRWWRHCRYTWEWNIQLIIEAKWYRYKRSVNKVMYGHGRRRL